MDIGPIVNGAQSGTTVSPSQVSGSGALSTAPSSSSGNTTATLQTASTVAQAQSASAAQHEPSADQVTNAVQKINTALSSQSQGIQFSIDSSSHRIVVKIVDQGTNQVIRQIPSKEALAIADSLDQSQGSLDQSQGLLIKQQA